MTDDFDNDDEAPALTPYAIRLAEDRQVVGIFVARDLDELAYLVDQCTDPSGTEYLRLGIGGVYVGGPTTAQWPAREKPDEHGDPFDVEPEDIAPFNGAELDDFWWLDMDNGDWIPLVTERLPTRLPIRRRRSTKRLS